MTLSHYVSTGRVNMVKIPVAEKLAETIFRNGVLCVVWREGEIKVNLFLSPLYVCFWSSHYTSSVMKEKGR